KRTTGTCSELILALQHFDRRGSVTRARRSDVCPEMTTRSQKRHWIAVCLLLLAFLLWWLWPRPPVTRPAPVPPIDGMPTNEELHTEGYWPLPFDDVDPGEPLLGRPDVQMPIPRRIYERVELTIDGEPVQEPIVLPAGKLV